jgi:copper chaperone CopZ
MKDISKKIYKLEGLDCSYCSTKIETELNNIEGINASVNFASSKLTVKSEINSNKNKV